jgi:hypothetical protein
MKKSELAEKIKRRLGYPLVKIELEAEQIDDAIDDARQKFMRWAVGQATQETYCLMMLSAGQYEYEMPSSCKEVIGYSTRTTGGINTLFTVDNYLFNMGMYDIFTLNESGYTLVSYHIARDFLDTMKKYSVDQWNFKYHPYTNILEINPTPASGNSLSWTDANGTAYGPYDSPGFMLIRYFAVEGDDEDIYTKSWVRDYATALCKVMLGRVRSKFESFASIGNTGISLDGSNLISEGKEEIEALSESVKDSEVYEGYGIEIG